MGPSAPGWLSAGRGLCGACGPQVRRACGPPPVSRRPPRAGGHAGDFAPPHPRSSGFAAGARGPSARPCFGLPLCEGVACYPLPWGRSAPRTFFLRWVSLPRPPGYSFNRERVPRTLGGESPATPEGTSTGLSPRVRLRLTPPASGSGDFDHLAPDEARCHETTEAAGRRLLPLSPAGVTAKFLSG